MQLPIHTPYHSYCTGKLSKGCQQCVKGQKLVLFITGLCGQRCVYCPVSEHKFGHDVVYANEWKIADPDDPKELLEEARLMKAKGAGITGGDPLVRLDRCVQYIRLLKSTFGKEFHIHLYTPLQLVTRERLQALYDAGLDEIRTHPSLESKVEWDRLLLLKEFDWVVGIEIPAMPGKETITAELIEFAKGKVDFMNFNELELSDTQAPHYQLRSLGFKPKDHLSYGVLGSAAMAQNLLRIAQRVGMPAHFCTAKLKDRVQLQNRMKRRALSTALPCDTITDEGLLLHGCLYLPDLAPGMDYDENFKNADRESTILVLREHAEKLKTLLSDAQVFVDEKKLRLVTSTAAAKRYAELFKSEGLVPTIVEEYPTIEGTETEIDFL